MLSLIPAELADVLLIPAGLAGFPWWRLLGLQETGAAGWRLAGELRNMFRYVDNVKS